MKNNIKQFIIRKDSGYPSKPWTADIEFNDGKKWVSWSHSFKTKRALVEHCECVSYETKIVSY